MAETVVVGAGQAGLAVSRELGRAGVEHVVLERGRVGETWRGRWESFCLVTPNWSVRLPGGEYAGDDPDGYMPRDEIVAHLERYARDAPVQRGVEATSLERAGGRLRLGTTAGELEARAVVLCTGAYQRAYQPPGAATLPPGLEVLDVAGYRSPDQLPDGAVLVVGSGQSGCQIAEELFEAGREVFLACGRAPWLPRRMSGRDLVWWGLESGFLDAPPSSLPSPAARLGANLLATGHGGGHDLHLRTLQALGVRLLGRFLGAEGRRALFAQDLAASVASGDALHARITGLFRRHAAEHGLDFELPDPEPFVEDAPAELELGGVGAVVFAGGFRPDYGSWLDFPEAFDDLGFPVHDEGESTAVDGLYFTGVHFLRKRKSSLLVGVGEDAAIVAERVARRVR